MATAPTQDDVHKLLKDTFLSTKTGYCWMIGKFGGRWNLYIPDVIQCVTAKRDMKLCPIHKRVHESRKRVKTI